jgi:hypothetical protein
MSNNNCEYCKNIFGIIMHDNNECLAQRLNKSYMMFCWHCHRINIQNNFKNLIVHYHNSSNCPNKCNNENCILKNYNHAKFDCNNVDMQNNQQIIKK